MDLKQPKLNQFKKINTIDNYNSDQMLSEFKYHFILRKVYMPRRVSIEELAETIHQGFGIPSLTPNSIYILQMMNVFEKDLVDLIVGFRRDQDAMKVARQVPVFKQPGHNSKIQLSTGFKIFMQELKTEAEKNMIDDLELGPKQQGQKKDKINEEEYERERSREKLGKKKDVRERLQQSIKPELLLKPESSNEKKTLIILLMIPKQTTRNLIITSLESRLADASKDITSCQFFEKKLPCFELCIEKQKSYDKVINQPLKIEYFHILPIPWTLNISQQLLSRQLVYACTSTSFAKSLPTLLRELKQKKYEIISILARPTGIGQNSESTSQISQAINTMNNASIDCNTTNNKQYVVTFFRKVFDIKDYLLNGWKVQKNINLEGFLEKPSVKWDWYRLMQQLQK